MSKSSGSKRLALAVMVTLVVLAGLASGVGDALMHLKSADGGTDASVETVEASSDESEEEEIAIVPIEPPHSTYHRAGDFDEEGNFSRSGTVFPCMGCHRFIP